MDEVLADGEWHDREELYAAGMPAVPPEAALAMRQRQIDYGREAYDEKRKSNRRGFVRYVEHEEKVRVGRREVVTRAIRDALQYAWSKDGTRIRHRDKETIRSQKPKRPKYIPAPAQKTRYRLAMDAVLADGEWHDRDEVIAAGVPLVPAGQAVRHRERKRQYHLNKNRDKPNGPKRVISEADRVLRGAIGLVRDATATTVRHRTWQRSQDHKRLRLHPLRWVGQTVSERTKDDPRREVYLTVQRKVRSGESVTKVALEHGLPFDAVRKIAETELDE